MSSKMSVAEIVTNLEKRLAFHRQQAAFHKEQEAVHRGQHEAHEAEAGKVAAHLESFRAVAGAAAELAAPPPAPPLPEEPDPGPRPLTSHLVTRVVKSQSEGEPFGATKIAAEVNRRYAGKLRRPVDGRLASVTLRRLHNDGQIHLVREGKPFHEALYSRGKRPAKE